MSGADIVNGSILDVSPDDTGKDIRWDRLSDGSGEVNFTVLQ